MKDFFLVFILALVYIFSVAVLTYFVTTVFHYFVDPTLFGVFPYITFAILLGTFVYNIYFEPILAV